MVSRINFAEGNKFVPTITPALGHLAHSAPDIEIPEIAFGDREIFDGRARGASTIQMEKRAKFPAYRLHYLALRVMRARTRACRNCRDIFIAHSKFAEGKC